MAIWLEFQATGFSMKRDLSKQMNFVAPPQGSDGKYDAALVNSGSRSQG
jgi:hypothetical protein